MDNNSWKKTFPKPPDSFHQRLTATLSQLPEKEEEFNMKSRKVRKNMSFRRVAVFALVAVLAVGTTAFASGKIVSLIGSSGATPDYTAMPTLTQINEDVGFQPKLIETFENGYKFDAGNVISNKALDGDDNLVGEYKQLNLTYSMEKQNVELYINEHSTTEKSPDSVLADTYGGSDLYFSEDNYKFVPADYVMTEQDKADRDSGKYVFSMGSQEVEIQNSQFLSWQDGSINYMFMAVDSNLNQKDLITMAHELIDAK